MAIPVGVILVWDGANGAIPTGWVRETSLDGKFPKAWGTQDPNVAGGANTHSHLSGHIHSEIAHTHQVWSGSSLDTQACAGSSGNSSTQNEHAHITVNLGGMSGGGLQSTNVTWTSVDHQPAYKKVIFIKPNGAPAPLHNGICAHLNDAVIPLGFTVCDGNNGTADYRNKFLKGADTGGDAGATGGDTKHQHTVTHGHTATAHNHAGVSGVPDMNFLAYYPNSYRASSTHTHDLTTDSITETVANYIKTDAGVGDTVEPAFKKLHLIKNIQGGVNEKAGLIGLWLGAVVDIPTNWALCDGNNGTNDLRDKYLKIALDNTELNGTGGSNTHTHTNISHSHTANAHGHTISYNQNGSSTGGDGGQGDNNVYQSHRHNWYQNNSTGSFNNTDLTSGSAVSNEPTYLTVAYIQLLRVVDNGASVMACL